MLHWRVESALPMITPFSRYLGQPLYKCKLFATFVFCAWDPNFNQQGKSAR